jgi:hypothetical protein
MSSPHADVDNWVQYWKSIFIKRLREPQCRWQRASLHHRIRSDEKALKNAVPI